jgi:hypothetical protein
MTAQQINRRSAKVIIVLSVLALLTVLSGYTYPPQPPEPDEGTAAHVFQLSIVAVALSVLVFFHYRGLEAALAKRAPTSISCGCFSSSVWRPLLPRTFSIRHNALTCQKFPVKSSRL